jgi:hypothetical protein
MAAPVDIAAAVAPMTSRISSEPLLLAAVVVIITAILASLAIGFVYRIFVKRDEVFKELSASVNVLSGVLGKVAQVQELDHSNTMRNRDILQELSNYHSRQDILLLNLAQEVKSLSIELITHAKECADKIRKGSV